MEILSTLIFEVGKCLYEPLKRHCGYLFCHTRKVDKLSEDVENLCIKSSDVDKKLEEASRSQEEPLQAVRKWKESVDNVIASQANILSDKLRLEQRGCCWCPNFISSRYKLGKDAARELDRVKKLSDDLNSFGTELTYCPRPSAVTFIRTDTIQTNESITTVEEQIKQALADHNIRSIGIHGMGGIGKTTLVKKINNDMMKDSNDLFDRVIMVTVSENPDLKVIQAHLAERLGLHINAVDAADHRADLLVKELKKYECVLIILDDVWQNLEMVRVGIPRRDEHPCCKIIITTRNREVCDRMRIDKKIAVQPWSLDDSKKLFQSKVGFDIVSQNPELQYIANEIVKECGGSPLAIVTLASALVGNQNEILWNEALRCLKSSDPVELENIEGMDTDVISSIRFSYNNLTGEGIKLCFLFCSLFPEDYEIDLFDLRTYGIGEGFLRGDGSLYEARGKLESYIERLKARNLLLDCDKKNKVKMHDVVRDVARFIASKEHGFKEIAGRGIHEWPMFDNVKGYKHMSLMNNDIRVLPNSSNLPELRTLLMQRNWNMREIPDTFFEGMNQLVNLDLSRTALPTLPSSISFLRSLRTLQISIFYGTAEIDGSLLGKLKNLEILILKSLRLKDPKELAALTKLKVLHLDQGLQSLPAGVLSKLIYLEELHLSLDEVVDNCAKFQEEVDNCAMFDEVASLKCLTKLRIAVDSRGIVARDIPICWNYNNLHEFDIRFSKYILMREQSYSKYLFCDELSSPIQKWIKCLLEKTEALQVRKNNDFKRIPHLDDMGSLKHLNVEEWAVMEHVANIEIFPQATNTMKNLENLHLERLAKLEKIIQGKVQDGFVMNLKTLRISNCEKILTVLPFDVLQVLQSLESIYVEDCISLTHLVSMVEAGIRMPKKTLEQVSSLLLYDLPNFISFCNGPIPTRFLTKLKVLSIKNCGKFTINILSHELVQSLEPLEVFSLENTDGAEVLFDFMSSNLVPPYALGRLRKLCLKRIMKMKNLISNEQGTIERGGLLPRLENLTLDDLPNFVSICTQPSQVENFSNLRELCVRECGKLQSLEEVFHLNNWMTMANESGPSGDVFKNLTELKVFRCHNLKYLFTLSTTQNGLQNLQFLEVNYCNKLKWVIGNEDEGKEGLVPSTKSLLCNLRYLNVQSCDKLENILVVSDKDEDSYSDLVVDEKKNKKILVLPQLVKIVLRDLPELTSLYGDGDANSFQLPSVEWITIRKCSKLRHLPLGPDNAPKLKRLEEEEDGLVVLNEGRLWRARQDSDPSLIRGWPNQLVGTFQTNLIK